MDYDVHRLAAIRDQDELEICPYEKSHVICKSRMQYHLVKCAKQHSLGEIITCPFNATHRFDKPIMPFHVRNCPDKNVLEDHVFQAQDRTSNLPEFTHVTVPASEENWDTTFESSYDPDVNVADKVMFRNIRGATKSERKKFRLQERRRMNQLTSGETPEAGPSHMPTQLRAPKEMPKGMAAVAGSRLGMGRGLPPDDTADQQYNAAHLGRGRGYRKN